MLTSGTGRISGVVARHEWLGRRRGGGPDSGRGGAEVEVSWVVAWWPIHYAVPNDIPERMH